MGDVKIGSDSADKENVPSKLTNEINIGYKFIHTNSYTLQEGGHKGLKGCVGGPGWRQLLRFTSSSVNVGKSDLHLGDVKTEVYLSHGVYEWDPCHLHFHFQHYENYLFSNVSGRKTGFCVQTTWRYFNNEYTPFNTPYSFCNYQGLELICKKIKYKIRLKINFLFLNKKGVTTGWGRTKN